MLTLSGDFGTKGNDDDFDQDVSTGSILLLMSFSSNVAFWFKKKSPKFNKFIAVWSDSSTTSMI